MSAPDDEECIHGLGDPAWCTLCNGREERERAEARKVTAMWPAKYVSLLNCGHFPEVGDALYRLGDGRIVCDECRP